MDEKKLFKALYYNKCNEMCRKVISTQGVRTRGRLFLYSPRGIGGATGLDRDDDLGLTTVAWEFLSETCSGQSSGEVTQLLETSIRKLATEMDPELTMRAGERSLVDSPYLEFPLLLCSYALAPCQRLPGHA